MNILACRQRVYQDTYNNNNLLRETGAFIMYNRIGGFTQYILTQEPLQEPPPALPPSEATAVELDGLAGEEQQESPV